MCACQPAPDPTLSTFVIILTTLQHLEATMATATEQLTALAAKVDDIAADFTALVTALAAERENLTEAGQAALDTAVAKVEALDAAVGDADGSDIPPVE